MQVDQKESSFECVIENDNRKNENSTSPLLKKRNLWYQGKERIVTSKWWMEVFFVVYRYFSSKKNNTRNLNDIA